jgi:hypothetical protein
MNKGPYMILQKLNFLFVACFLVYTLNSCQSPEYLSEGDLSQYVSNPDNGLFKSVSSNGITVNVTYRPTDLIVAQHLNNALNADKNEITRLRNKFKNYYYFIVSFSKGDRDILNASSDFSGFSDLLQTLSFRMSAVVNLTTPSDTVPVVDFNYNRMFGMSNSADVLFVFENTKAGDDEWVRINVDEFGLGIGKQRFEFKTNALKCVPKIYKLSSH